LVKELLLETKVKVEVQVFDAKDVVTVLFENLLLGKKFDMNMNLVATNIAPDGVKNEVTYVS
jgi:hypothetical protein